MKRFLMMLLILVTVISMSACGMVIVDEDAEVRLIAIYDPLDIDVKLEGEEAEKIIAIVNYSLSYSDFGTPACGFAEGYSIKVGDQLFALPWDGCNTLKDVNNNKYLDVSESDMEYIHSLIDKYR